MNQIDKQIRTCIVTGEKHNKADMIRIVSFRGEPIQFDLTGKKEGRGCYVIADENILSGLTAKNGVALARTFKRKINQEEIEYLKNEFPKAVEEKKFRPRISKPVVVRVKREELRKTM